MFETLDFTIYYYRSLYTLKGLLKYGNRKIQNQE